MGKVHRSIFVIASLLCGCGQGIGTPFKSDKQSALTGFQFTLGAESVAFNQSLQLTTVNGRAPITYQAQGCVSTVDSNGVFHASSAAETCTVVANDSALHSASIQITVAATVVHGFAYLEANLFSQCAGCHGSTTFGTYGGLMASGMVVAGHPSQSSIYNIVSGGAMPPGGTSASIVSDLSAWIQGGAPNN